MEVVLNGELESFVPKGMTFNYDDISKWLDSKLEAYRGMVVGERNYKEAKRDRALINSTSNALLNEYRKWRKRVCEPLDRIKEQISALCGKCNEVASELDENIKAVENARKSEKLERLMEYAKERSHSALCHLKMDEKSENALAERYVTSCSDRFGLVSMTEQKCKDDIDAYLSQKAIEIDVLQRLYYYDGLFDMALAKYCELGYVLSYTTQSMDAYKTMRAMEKRVSETSEVTPEEPKAKPDSDIVEVHAVFRCYDEDADDCIRRFIERHSTILEYEFANSKQGV